MVERVAHGMVIVSRIFICWKYMADFLQVATNDFIYLLELHEDTV